MAAAEIGLERRPVVVDPALAIPIGLVAKPAKTLPEEVQHKLATLPYYNLFDELAFKVDGTTVTLTGQVTRPVVKDDAANAVKHCGGRSHRAAKRQHRASEE